MATAYLLTIDQGTSGTRAILYDQHAKPSFESYHRIARHYPKPGWVEQDATEIWDSVCAVTKQVMELSGARASMISSLAISNQRETTVFWDRITGEPLRPVIVWQCRRSTDICHAWKSEGLESLVREHTGLSIDPYFSASKIAWALQNDSRLRARARQNRLIAGTVDSYLVWKLTGGQTLGTDYTNASRTMLFDIRTLEWDKTLCNAFDIPDVILPPVIRGAGPIGYTARVGPFPQGIAIAVTIGDQQASLFGHGCLTPGTAKVTYGTGCFFLVNQGTELSAHRNHALIDTLCWSDKEQVAYALEGSIFAAGTTIEWLVDKLGIAPAAVSTNRIARQLESSNGVYFVPAFAGLGAPYWDPDARAALFGVTAGTTRAHLVRSGLESIAYRVRDLIEIAQTHLGFQLPLVRADGGVSRNDFLMQFQADILGVPVIQSDNSDTTALGAAMLAGRRIGFWAEADPNTLIPAGKRFTPRMSCQRRAELYHGWKESVARVLKH